MRNLSSKYGIIYKISNNINNKLYIGQTLLSLKGRFKEHSKKRNIKSAINSSIKKYGVTNFKIEPVCSAINKKYLNELEIYFINFYNSIAPNGYNLKEGGSNGKLHVSTKLKLSKILKNRPTKGRATKGWTHYNNKPIISRCIKTGVETCYPNTEITKELGFCPTIVRLCIKNKGRSKSHKGYFWRYANQEYIPITIKDVRKKVKAIDVKTNKTFIFNSLAEAEKYTKTNHSHISSCCKKLYGRKTANGFKWEYLNEET